MGTPDLDSIIFDVDPAEQLWQQLRLEYPVEHVKAIAEWNGAFTVAEGEDPAFSLDRLLAFAGKVPDYTQTKACRLWRSAVPLLAIDLPEPPGGEWTLVTLCAAFKRLLRKRAEGEKGISSELAEMRKKMAEMEKAIAVKGGQRLPGAGRGEYTDSMEAQVAAIKHGEEATAPPNQFATVYREDPFWAPMPGDVEINAAEATKGKQARSPLSFQQAPMLPAGQLPASFSMPLAGVQSAFEHANPAGLEQRRRLAPVYPMPFIVDVPMFSARQVVDTFGQKGVEWLGSVVSEIQLFADGHDVRTLRNSESVTYGRQPVEAAVPVVQAGVVSTSSQQRTSAVPQVPTVVPYPNGEPSIAFQAVGACGDVWSDMVTCPLVGAVKLDSGAQPLVISTDLATMLNLTYENGGLVESPVSVSGWQGPASKPYAMTAVKVNVIFNPLRASSMTTVSAYALVVNKCGYSALLGVDVLARAMVQVDYRAEEASYIPDWDGAGLKRASVPVSCFSSSAGAARLNPSAAAGVVEVSMVEVRAAGSSAWDKHRTVLPQPTASIAKMRTQWSLDAVTSTRQLAMRKRVTEAVVTVPQMASHGLTLVQPGVSEAQGNFSAAILPQAPDFAKGAVVLELFAGIGGGIAGFLAAGGVCRKLIAVEPSHKARQVYFSHCGVLSREYPAQFPPSAWRDPFGECPQDIRAIGEVQVQQLLRRHHAIDLVIAGWECQGLSQAGQGRGLADPRSALFWELLRVVGLLQSRQPHPPAYLFENVVAGDSPHQAVREDWATIVALLGEPIVCDNAGLGGLTHRLRAYWTNVACATGVQAVLGAVARQHPSVSAEVALPSHLVTQKVDSEDRPPYARVNRVGSPMCALPTLVSYQGSTAYRDRVWGGVPSQSASAG
eukprot:jgi/Mesvir1/13565/Mv19666-RA.1